MASGPALAKMPKVVVTIKPVHALVAGVMAGAGMPGLVVEGAASPHTFHLKPSTARDIATADFFIRVSPALEPFTVKLTDALPKSVKVVTLADAKDVKLFEQRQGGAFEPHEHDHGNGKAADHDDGDDDAKDGHIWLDPENAKAIVNAAAEVLSEHSPENAELFKRNAASLLARIGAMQEKIAARLETVRDKPFIVFHDATQYFERRFGLAAIGSITIGPEAQPSVRRLTAIRKKIANFGAACVFAEPGFQPGLLAAVTEGSTAKIGTLDAEGLLLSPGVELYFDLMEGLANNAVACLSGANSISGRSDLGK